MVDITHLNTFGLRAHARSHVQLHTVAEAQAFLQAKGSSNEPVLVLGGGSNVLFTKDWPGTVVQLCLQEVTFAPVTEAFTDVYAGAGVVWNDLVQQTVARGLGGLENLTLIWGWVGAAPMQNIGAYGVEVKDTITQVHTLDAATGQPRIFSNAECAFGYRESVFKHALKGQYWITGVTFRLANNPRLNLNYGDIRKTLNEMEVSEPTVQHVSRAVAAIRTSKLPDPRQEGNAGSFFKNPEVAPGIAAALQARHPLMPTYPGAAGLIKIPAGWLIEQAGWKGHRRPTVGVHPRQALVLVHYGGGTGAELLQLAQDIQADVSAKFGIKLSPEVNIL